MYNGTKVLDVHGHVSAPGGGFATLLLSSNTASPSPIASGSGRGEYSDEAFHERFNHHLNYMTEREIDVQVIGPRPFTMLGFMAKHLLPSWTAFTNDRIHKQCAWRPDKFLGAAMLPQIASAPDISHCLPELERCVKDCGFVATYVSPDPTGLRDSPGMHESYWYPLYEYCQRNGLPIIVHGTNCQDPRISIVRANYQIGFTVEEWIAGLLFAHSDVFEKFPELKVVICHGGGALDRFVEEAGWRNGRGKDLSKNLFYDSCTYDPVYLEAMIKQRGVNQVLFGSEAPGSGGAVRKDTGKSSDHLIPVIAGFGFLSEEEKVKIVNKNPAKVFPKLATK
ncbi:MAG TPA: amidohydrolase family protein [Dehalococcoidia bacterium]|nr:amidohydrolase family protein [Dehalococcoidia bacterium]